MEELARACVDTGWIQRRLSPKLIFLSGAADATGKHKPFELWMLSTPGDGCVISLLAEERLLAFLCSVVSFGHLFKLGSWGSSEIDSN